MIAIKKLGSLFVLVGLMLGITGCGAVQAGYNDFTTGSQQTVTKDASGQVVSVAQTQTKSDGLTQTNQIIGMVKDGVQIWQKIRGK